MIKKPNTKQILIYSAVLQLILSALFYGYSFKVTHDNIVQDSPTEIIAEHFKQIDRNYQSSRAKYETVIDSLQKRISVSDSLLQKEKIISENSENKVTALLNQDWDTLSLETKSVECDSLREKVSDYVKQEDKRDTLFQTTINSLVAISEEKSLQIKNCDSSYTRMKSELENSLHYSKLCNEKLRKQKKQNRILKIGSALIAAFTIGFVAK